MFENQPIARRLDPVTSQQAAAGYTQGNRRRDVEMMYELIHQLPGHTAAEYGDILRGRGMNWYRAARLPTKRISELVNNNRVVIGKRRQCAVTRHNAQTYYANP